LGGRRKEEKDMAMREKGKGRKLPGPKKKGSDWPRKERVSGTLIFDFRGGRRTTRGGQEEDGRRESRTKEGLLPLLPKT